jgi:hypothetical protein
MLSFLKTLLLHEFTTAATMGVELEVAHIWFFVKIKIDLRLRKK